MLRSLFLFSLIVVAVLFFAACSKSSGGGGVVTPGFCDGVVSKYAADVEPIIATSCLLGSNCHSSGSSNAGGELTDYNKVFNKRSQIRAAVNSGIMPQTGTLTLDQKKKIICWIDSGAPNN